VKALRFEKIIKFLCTNPNYQFSKNIEQNILIFLSSTEKTDQLSEQGDDEHSNSLKKERN
jgi:hypothetical protein